MGGLAQRVLTLLSVLMLAAQSQVLALCTCRRQTSIGGYRHRRIICSQELFIPIMRWPPWLLASGRRRGAAKAAAWHACAVDGFLESTRFSASV